MLHSVDVYKRQLRVCAEYDNFRKRSQKEREGIYADAAADSLKELLPLIDNLERATQYTNPEKVAEGVETVSYTHLKHKGRSKRPRCDRAR